MEAQFVKSYFIDGLLDLVRIAATGGDLDRLHAAIEHEIAEASHRVERAKVRGDDYLDSVIDDECDRIEELLGLAFVVGQVFITDVRSHIDSLSKACRTDLGHPLSFAIHPKAYDVLRMSVPLRPDSPHTVAQVINAIANYWKHEGDWPICEQVKGRRLLKVWDSPAMNERERQTVEIVRSIGMTAFSTGNLRKAANEFGVTDYKDLSPVRQKPKDWASCLYRATLIEVSGSTPTKSL